ncbi:Ig-like domain-containing protein [Vulgatibacter incomptus]|nr:Ig-like domain-containing protein [Vulgatibacter incomptus]
MKFWCLFTPRSGALLLTLALALAGAGCGSKKSGGVAGTGGEAGSSTGGSGGDGGTGGEGGSGGAGGEGGTGEGGSGGTVAPIERVEVSPDAVSVIEHRSFTLTAKAYDANDEERTGIEVIWSSSDESIATVEADGVVTGIQPGEVEITASVGDRVGVAHIAVTEGTIASIVFAADSNEVVVDGTATIIAVALDEDGLVLLGRSFSWSSSNEDIAPVDGAGVVAGVEPGVSRITAAIGDVSATLDVSVVHRFVSISAGDTHTCALNAAGAAWCWGANWSGQLGNGDTADEESHPIPVRVGPGLGLRFTSLSAGESFTCGLTADGDVWCWGDNGDYQLGFDDISGAATPVLVPGSHYAAISTMYYGICGLDFTGRAHCWGYSSNDYELGDADVTDSTATPVAVSGPFEGEEPLDFVVLRNGEYHSCGLTPANRLFCWGYNSSGQLGDGSRESRARPVEPLPGETVVAFGLGNAHTCAVTADEKTWCWGANRAGQSGTASGQNILAPTLLFDGSEFVPAAFAMGDSHSCAVDAVGAVWCWGVTYGEIFGREEGDVPAEPGPIDGGLSFTSISARGEHTCGIATDGKAYCWGSNRSGALGVDVSIWTSALPLPVYGQSPVICLPDCTGACGGSAEVDCEGVCGGSAMVDCDGVCGGSAVEDCEGTCGGSATEDCEGACGGSTTEDCEGVCGGSAVEDCEGTCGGSAELDCAEVCGGSATVDACGICVPDGEDDPCISTGIVASKNVEVSTSWPALEIATLSVRREDGPNPSHVYLGFDLGGLPADATVRGVELRLHAVGGFAFGGDGNTYTHFVPDNTWTAGFDWQSAPAFDPTPAGKWWLWFAGPGSAMATIDGPELMDFVQAQLEGDGFVSFMLRSPGYDTYYDSRFAANPEDRPTLVVTYTLPE